MAAFYDISNWQEKPHFQTGGTRNKIIVENPNDGNLYYFKTSLKRANDEYKYEFWSEIIASQIGRLLKFDTLQYDVAVKDEDIGCLSKSMVDTDINKLSEGINYLCGYDATYNPSNKATYSRYTFGFIEKALKKYRLEDAMKHIITTIIFDSLIGNGDRHQENWGFITPNIPNKSIRGRVQLKTKPLFGFKLFKNFPQEPINGDDVLKVFFLPIYDSGSCLGRELSNEKVRKMLHDNQMMEAYINRDLSELRWQGEKISHFNLIKLVIEETQYAAFVKDEINKVVGIFDIEAIGKTIYEVDKNISEEFAQHILPDYRKELMKKIISLRFERLKRISK